MTATMECEFPDCKHVTKTFQSLKEALQALEVHDRQVHGEEYVKRDVKRGVGLQARQQEGTGIVKMEKEKTCPEFIHGQRYEFWEKTFNEWYERDMDNGKDPIKIRQGLTKMLQNTENAEVKKYYLDSIMNNESVNGNHVEIINKLKDRFKKNERIECQEVVKAWKNYKYGDEGSGKALDRLSNLRTMLNRNLKKDKEVIALTVNDKILLTQFLMAGEEEGKIDKIDRRKMEEEFETDKYNWDKARATIRKYKIEKEQIGQTSEINYVDRSRSFVKNSDYKRSYSGNNFKREGSANWKRSNSGNTFKREGSRNWNGRNGSRSQSRNGSRHGSQNKDGNRESTPIGLKDLIKGLSEKVDRLNDKTKGFDKTIKEITEIKTKLDELNQTNVSGLGFVDHRINHMGESASKLYWIQGKKSLIIDTGAPKTVVGKAWIQKYLLDNGIDEKDLEKEQSNDLFKFGPGKVYESEGKWKIPIILEDINGDKVNKTVNVHVIDAKVPMLCGWDQQEEWKIVLDSSKYQCKMTDGVKKSKFGLHRTSGGHITLDLFENEEKLYYMDTKDLDTKKLDTKKLDTKKLDTKKLDTKKLDTKNNNKRSSLRFTVWDITKITGHIQTMALLW